MRRQKLLFGEFKAWLMEMTSAFGYKNQMAFASLYCYTTYSLVFNGTLPD